MFSSLATLCVVLLSFLMNSQASDVNLIGYFLLTECPDGWQRHYESIGRVTRAAGNFTGATLDGRAEVEEVVVVAIGGEGSVVLTTDQLPAHNHANGIFDRLLTSNCFYTSDADDRTCGEPNIIDSAPLATVGQNKSHSNWPPWIALLACRKIVDPIPKLQEDLAILQKDLATLQVDPAILQKDLADLQKDLETSQKDLATSQKDLASLQKDLATSQKDMATSQKDLASLQKDLATSQKDMVTLQTKYESLAASLSQQSPLPTGGALYIQNEASNDYQHLKSMNTGLVVGIILCVVGLFGALIFLICLNYQFKNLKNTYQSAAQPCTEIPTIPNSI